MDTNNEFGDYMTESNIKYIDTGNTIIITSNWTDISPKVEEYEERIKYLLRLDERLSYCITEKEQKYLKEKINKIPEKKLKKAAILLNPRSFRLNEWLYSMSIILTEDYIIDGSKIYRQIIKEINKIISK